MPRLFRDLLHGRVVTINGSVSTFDQRMKDVLFVVVFLCAPLWPSGAIAQSLADVAREEEARRKTVKLPGRIYTNADLKPVASPASAPAAPVEPPGWLASEKDSSSVKGASEKDDASDKTEAYWKTLITAARGALDRSRVLADALQSRLNALATDIVNRDDPAQRAELELEHRRALGELDRTKADIGEQTKAIADIQEDARKAGVPPGWLR